MENNSGSSNALVAIIAIVVILFIGWYAVQLLSKEQNDETPIINVSLGNSGGTSAP